MINFARATISVLLILVTITGCSDRIDPGNASTGPAIVLIDTVFDPPESCTVVEPPCYSGCINCALNCRLEPPESVEGCLAQCAFTSTEQLCTQKCKTVVSSTCGECQPRPMTRQLCVQAGNDTIDNVSCDAGAVAALEALGYECGSCERIRLPGQYKDCSCGEQSWQSFCPDKFAESLRAVE